MIADPWFYAAAIPAMLILGLSKGGFTTMGMLSVPIMALVISPVQAAGIVLPILVLSDIVALISYRNVFDSRTLKIVLPAAVIGIAIGWATAAWVTEHHIRLIVGVVSVLFALNYWFRDRLKQEPHGPNVAKGGFWGVIAGFTSFVSHAGGPPFQMYAVPLRLAPRIYAGTSVILFAAINAIKLVPYFFLGQFDATNLTTSAILLPVSIPATFFGVWLVKKFETDAFYKWIYASIFVVGVYLIFEGATNVI
ncbi:MAG: sulfite exporter TauE/SafE family protein [Dongiaceae bacterium]